MNSYRTVIFLMLIIVSASAATSYAAASRIQRNAVLTSSDATIASDPISVGTQNGGIVSELSIQDGQTVSNGDTLMVLKRSGESEEKVVAPHDGVVENLQVTSNSFIKPNSDLLDLIDPSQLYVSAKLKVSPDQFLEMQNGMPVDIQIGSGGHFAGHLSGIYPHYDSATQTATVLCAFNDSTDSQRLVPGLPAQVSVQIPSASLDFVKSHLGKLRLP